MGTTASGFWFPDVGYTSGWRQAIEDAADANENIIAGTRAARTFAVADNAELAALASTYTLSEGLDFARRDDDKITYRYNGSAWKAWESDWITYPPTLSNIAVGTGGSAASVHVYKYLAGDVRLKACLVLGSSGASVSGIPTITLPVNHAPVQGQFEYVGAATLLDSPGSPYIGSVLMDAANVAAVRIYPVHSGVVGSAVSSTVPFTWAAADSITYDVTYRPA